MKKILNEHLDDINKNAKKIKRNITIMEVCGGHTNTIMRYGIREKLPSNIKLISGPGCPVCVSPQYDIDCMIELATIGIPIATYGDMLKVPGNNGCLEDIKARGGQVFEIYSTTEVLELKKEHPDIVFFGVGFETTAPMTAYLLKNNICVYSVHKLIPPALKILTTEEARIDGFLDPGHVSAIIGRLAYEDIKIPQVITGFTPERVLRGISALVELIRENKKIVLNAYPEVVKEDGNINAKNQLKRYFRIIDSDWRGLGTIPDSGFEVRDDRLNAKIKYGKLFINVQKPKKTGCRCGEILKGLITPVDCPMYGKSCTPVTPQGACMVSSEGSCAIYYQYRK